MVLEPLPEFVRTHYEVYEWKHAIAILKNDFPDEYRDIMDVLASFRLRQSDIQKPGGRKSDIAEAIDNSFTERGWREKGFRTKVVVDTREIETPTRYEQVASKN